MDSFNRENSAWCITDGSAGMVSQVKGLALAMKLDYTLKEVKLNFPWNILPVGIVPILSSAFSNLFDFKKQILLNLLLHAVEKAFTYLFF